MQYITKFNIDQVVCFKDIEGGVMQGKIIGLRIEHADDDDDVPTEYELRTRSTARTNLNYLIVVQAQAPGRRGIMRRVSEARVALTFEDAWKLP